MTDSSLAEPPGADLAVVSGASGGLGPAVVAAFAARGDRVVAVGRSVERLRGLEEQYRPRVRIESADLSSAEEVEALWLRLDERGESPRWVVNLAGGFRPGAIADPSLEIFASMHARNLASAWWSCRAAAARLRERGDGAIVNVSSRSAVTASPGALAYAVAKAGVIKLTTDLAEDLKASGVRVNAILPSVIDTPANRESMPARLLEKAVTPDAVAGVVAYLCSDAARPITGAVIPV